MLNYEKIDHLIVEAIRQPGEHTFASLMSGDIAAEAKKLRLEEIAERGVSKAAPSFRIIDRRLQALRKRGLIRYSGGRWHATKEAA